MVVIEMGSTIFVTELMLTLMTLVWGESIYISHFNRRRPADSIFVIKYGLSYRECFNLCVRVRLCRVMDYSRRFQQCRLSSNQNVESSQFKQTGSAIAWRPPGSGANQDPVLDLAQIPGCEHFRKNIDDVTIHCKGETEIFTRQPDGQITSHVTVFRAFTGDGIDVYDSWINRQNVTMVTSCVNNVTCNGRHFRHVLVDEFDSADVKQVRYSLKKGGQEVTFIQFEGQGHDLESWFTNSGIINSSWTELTSIPNFLYFSINGTGSGRRFFICELFNTCKGDLVVTMATTNTPHQCDWDRLTDAPQISYCDTTGPCKAPRIKVADSMEIVWYF